MRDLSRDLANCSVTFCVGTATSLGPSQSAFDNLLIRNIPRFSPNIDPKSVIEIGATEIRSHFAATDVPGIVAAYLDSLRVVYATVIAYGGVAALGAAWYLWSSLKE